MIHVGLYLMGFIFGCGILVDYLFVNMFIKKRLYLIGILMVVIRNKLYFPNLKDKVDLKGKVMLRPN